MFSECDYRMEVNEVKMKNLTEAAMKNYIET